MKIGRTDPCHCGSGKRYKNCCRDKDEAAEAAEAASAAVAKTAPAPPSDAEKAATTPAAPTQGGAFKKGTAGQTPAFPRVPPPPRTKMMRKRAV